MRINDGLLRHMYCPLTLFACFASPMSKFFIIMTIALALLAFLPITAPRVTKIRHAPWFLSFCSVSSSLCDCVVDFILQVQKQYEGSAAAH